MSYYCMVQGMLLCLLLWLGKVICPEICSYNLVEYGNVLPIEGDDVSLQLQLPFNFSFYCDNYDTIGVSTNGLVTLGYDTSMYINTPVNSSSGLNSYIASFWTDLITKGNTIYYKATTNSIVLQWTNMEFYNTNIPVGTFQTILYKNGTIELNYLQLLGTSSATVGIRKNSTQFASLEQPIYSGLHASISPNTCVSYSIVATNTSSDIVELITPELPYPATIVNPMDAAVYPRQIAVPFYWTSGNVSPDLYFKLYISYSQTFDAVIYQNINIRSANLTLELPIGQYYWKLYTCRDNVGCRESCIQSLTVIETILTAPSPPPPKSPLSPPPPYIPYNPPPQLPSSPPPNVPDSPPPPPKSPLSPPPPYIPYNPPPQLPSSPPPNVPDSPPPPPKSPLSPPPPYIPYNPPPQLPSSPPPNVPDSPPPNVPNSPPPNVPDSPPPNAPNSPPPNAPNSPPPNGPPPNSPPTELEDNYIEATSTSVSTAITTVVTTSVVGSVSTSVVASSGSLTSPMGLVGLVSMVQLMNINGDLQLGENQGQLLKQTASKLGWTCLDFPSDTNAPTGRRLLDTHYSSAGKLILYTYPALLAFSAIHLGLLWLYRKKKIVGFIVFPNLEIIIASVLVNPYCKAAGRLFREGTVNGGFAGLGILLALPLPLFGLGLFVIWKYVFKDKTVKFIVFKPLEQFNDSYHFIQRCLFSGNLGFWTDKGKLLSRYGYFLKNVRGPIYQFVDKEIRWDPRSCSYKWGKVFHISEKLGTIRTYYGVLYILRNILLSIILLSFPNSPAGSIAQLVLLNILLAIHCYCMVLFIAPFNDKRLQLTNVTSSLCELGVYFFGLLLVITKLNVFDKLVFAFQVTAVCIQVSSQLYNIGYLLLHAVYIRIRYGNHYDQSMIERVLGRKYFNRWRQNTIKVQID